MSKFESMSDEYLKKIYVPDVYQPDIFAIDYDKLKASGVKLISYDIDDTIVPFLDRSNKPSNQLVTFFENLKKDFIVVLITNANEKRAAGYASSFGIGHIQRAEKPRTTSFENILSEYNLKINEMAHVGNSMMNDVAGGNTVGVITCLVKHVGTTTQVGNKTRKVLGILSEGQELREELKKRGIFRKHHKFQDNDQYYQLGEVPAYQSLM